MRAALLATLFATAFAGQALAQTLQLDVDQARSIRLNTPVTGIVVGNAGVADVIVHSPNLIFVLGKSVGETHLMAVDERGRTIYSGTVEVRAGEPEGLVTVQRGRETFTQQCDERCVAVLHPEASAAGMSAASGAISARSAFTRGGGGN